MAILFNNSTVNILGTPGMYSDTFANRPSATNLAIGTIFVSIDTGAMYQTDGSNWYSIGVGSGSTPGIDSVLAVNQSLTDNRFIGLSSYDLKIENGNTSISASALNSINVYDDNIYTNIDIGIKGLQLDFASDIYRLGDMLNLSKGNFIEVDNATTNIQTYQNGVTFGYQIKGQTQAYFGDFDINQNGTYIFVDDTNETFTINALSTIVNSSVQFQLNTESLELTGTGLTSATSGVNAPLHLVVLINGVQYKIQLKLP